MAKYKDITLSDGREVRVYVPPTIKLSNALLRRYPDPDPPIRESKTVTGEIMKMAIVDDPEYLRDKAEVAAKRDEELDRVGILYALKDVKVPEGWDIEAEQGDLIRMADPEWQPREGELGCKLDYIEWDLLANLADSILVQQAINELSGIDMEAVDRLEDSFRRKLAGETDSALADGGSGEAEGGDTED